MKIYCEKSNKCNKAINSKSNSYHPKKFVAKKKKQYEIDIQS